MTTRIQNAQEPFTETQSDSLGKRTRDDYEKERKKLAKWLHNITDYNSQALTEDSKLILQDITLDMDVLFNEWLQHILEKTKSLDGRNLTSHLTRTGSSSWTYSAAGLVNVIQVWLHCGWNFSILKQEMVEAQMQTWRK